MLLGALLQRDIRDVLKNITRTICLLLKSDVEKPHDGEIQIDSIDENPQHEISSGTVGDSETPWLNEAFRVDWGADYFPFDSFNAHAGEQHDEDRQHYSGYDSSRGCCVLALSIVPQ